MTLPLDFIHNLEKLTRPGILRADSATRTLYSTDASIYQLEPLGVAFPRHQEELHAAVELAARYKVPILPRGSGSSLAGQAIGHALILDCSRYLNNILEINPQTRSATVEPGVVLADLNKAAAKHGLMFGPDPASAERATLGGVIGNNATGAHSILYGMTADHLLSADVLMADGSLATWGEIPISVVSGNWKVESESTHPNYQLPITKLHSAIAQIRETYANAIQQNYPKTWRNSGGYRLNYLLPWSPATPPQWTGESYPANLKPDTINLSTLLAGSEGTLAVIRRATLNLVPKPNHTILAVLAYESIPAACDDVPRLLELQPSAIELIPQMILRLSRSLPAYAGQMSWLAGDPAALLVVEFSGADPALLAEKAKSVGETLHIASNPVEQAKIWAVRKVGLGILDSRPQSARPVAFIEDCAIPVERLGDFIREIEALLAAHHTQGGIYAHASAGCLHIRPILNLKTLPGLQSLRQIAEATLAITLRVGGSMSSEHGDGLLRSEFLQKIYGDEVMEAFRTLKRAADPENLLNPGKITASPALDASLRYGSSYQAAAWPPALDFSRNGGLDTAIEQCNGQGVCRKSGGVMCPSFQATREEMNSTRGRANLLRAMIAFPSPLTHLPKGDGNRMRPSPFGGGAGGEGAAKGALDLCLACKGCKAECPSGVDMAKLKYEFQNEYYKTHRRPLRDYLFANIGDFARIFAPFGGLIDALNSFTPTQTLINQLFGLSPNRQLPKFAPEQPANRKTGQPENRKTATPENAILLRDAFTHFFEPEIEAAALQVLTACGISITPLPFYGAGRTLLSKGFIEPARRHAERILDAIRSLDPDDSLPVLGLEPSEIYTLRDEFFDLLPNRRAEVASLAARAWPLDEFLIRPGKDGVKRITHFPLSTVHHPLPTVLHGHCYQKAQPPHPDGFPVGQAASAEMLRALGYSVEIIPSGCCGMAGAFGYEAEHYDVSMAVGELVLFPALREKNISPERGDMTVAAPGASCRAQMADGVQARAEHPIVLAARMIAGADQGLEGVGG